MAQMKEKRGRTHTSNPSKCNLVDGNTLRSVPFVPYASLQNRLVRGTRAPRLTNYLGSREGPRVEDSEDGDDDGGGV